MNLAELLAKGAAVSDGYEAKTVKWRNGEEEVSFEIQAKVEMSAADFEFIYAAASPAGERHVAARRVHRLCLLGGEVIPLETAKTLKISLLTAIAAVLPEPELGDVQGKA